MIVVLAGSSKPMKSTRKKKNWKGDQFREGGKKKTKKRRTRVKLEGASEFVVSTQERILGGQEKPKEGVHGGLWGGEGGGGPGGRKKGGKLDSNQKKKWKLKKKRRCEGGGKGTDGSHWWGYLKDAQTATQVYWTGDEGGKAERSPVRHPGPFSGAPSVVNQHTKKPPKKKTRRILIARPGDFPPQNYLGHGGGRVGKKGE